jgi:hypothetical protein
VTDLNQLNEYGVPLHACNGYRCDEHYWARLTHLRLMREAAKVQ